MKKTKFILAILCLMGLTAFGQTDAQTSVTGTIQNVRKYKDQYAMTVGTTNLVLIVNLQNKTGSDFEINKEYADLLVKKDGAYVLNPKYSGKTLKITYSINGKGWKYIQTIEPVKQ